MKKLFFAVVILLSLSGVSRAQVPGYPGACPTCVVYSAIDWATHDVIAGWAFECTTGRAIDRVDLWYTDDAGGWHLMPSNGATGIYNETYGIPIPRPDVAAYFSTACPSVTANAGVHYVPPMPIPAGPRDLWVVYFRGPMASVQQYHLSE